jgi:hypothetical protein
MTQIDLVGELRNRMYDTDIATVDKVLEFLIDQDCLNDKGKDLRHHFWERYSKNIEEVEI